MQRIGAIVTVISFSRLHQRPFTENKVVNGKVKREWKTPDKVTPPTVRATVTIYITASHVANRALSVPRMCCLCFVKSAERQNFLNWAQDVGHSFNLHIPVFNQTKGRKRFHLYLTRIPATKGEMPCLELLCYDWSVWTHKQKSKTQHYQNEKCMN